MTNPTLNKEEVEELFKQGNTTKQVAGILEVSFSKLRWFLRSNKIVVGKKPEKKLSDKEERKVYLYFKDHGIHKTCEKFNVSRDVVYRINKSFLKIKEQQITDEYLIKLKESAKAKAHYKDKGYMAADFATYAVIRAMEIGRTVNLKYIWMNFLETHNDGYHILYTEEPEDGIQTAQVAAEDLEDTDRLKADEPIYRVCDRYKLDREERIMLILRYQYDFTYTDIGKMFGLTESRILQCCKAILATIHRDWLRKGLKNDEECLDDLRDLCLEK